VAAKFSCLVEKIPFFHGLRLFPSSRFYSILVPAHNGTRSRDSEPELKAGTMPKRKPGKFSVTKAVKANARERVGQPKPARIVDTEPRTGREAKHKPKLEQIIQSEE
jgi:hypothetical protein